MPKKSMPGLKLNNAVFFKVAGWTVRFRPPEAYNSVLNVFSPLIMIPGRERFLLEQSDLAVARYYFGIVVYNHCAWKSVLGR